MAHSPLAQFEIKKIVHLELFGIDISITNSACFLAAALLCIAIYFWVAFRKPSIIPSYLQLTGELLYSTTTQMLEQNVGEDGRRFIPFIFSLFIFVMTCNLLGMIPYGFTATSHIILTFALAMFVFIAITVVGFVRHGFGFFAVFLPKGTPWWLAPLMVLIEMFTYLARPVSLSLRLAANMVAGHVLLKIIAGFVISLWIFLKILPIPLMVALIGFEIFVALLQAYIFTILSCVYLGSVIHLH